MDPVSGNSGSGSVSSVGSLGTCTSVNFIFAKLQMELAASAKATLRAWALVITIDSPLASCSRFARAFSRACASGTVGKPPRPMSRRLPPTIRFTR